LHPASTAWGSIGWDVHAPLLDGGQGPTLIGTLFGDGNVVLAEIAHMLRTSCTPPTWRSISGEDSRMPESGSRTMCFDTTLAPNTGGSSKE
jgi:hypothetical protein